MARMSTALRDITALVVEDDEQNMRFVTNILLDMGMLTFYTASDGQAGWENLQEHKREIGLVICDWNLPRLSGIQILERMQEARIDKPFVMLTGRGTMESVIEASAYGVDAYLPKPFTPEQLARKILPLVGGSTGHITV